MTRAMHKYKLIMKKLKEHLTQIEIRYIMKII